MTTTPYTHFIGIDVAKDTLDIAVNKDSKQLFHLQISNDIKGLKDLLKEANAHSVDLKSTLFCLEATGIYHTTLTSFLHDHGCAIWIENAVMIQRSLGFQRGKTDQLDAQRIAHYAWRFRDKAVLWQPSREVTQQLKALTTTRSRLVKTYDSLIQPLSDYKKFTPDIYRLTEKSCREAIKSLKQAIKAVEKQIKTLVDSDEQLQHQYKLVTSVKGIGFVSACYLLAVTDEFTKFATSKQLSCYAGVVPFERSSGSSLRGKPRVSHWSDKRLKSILHMAALSVIQVPGELRDYYERQIARGKPKLSVINAIKNKLLLRVCACIRDDRPYIPDYVYQVA